MTTTEAFADRADMHALELRAGRYAKVMHVGPYSELERPYTWLSHLVAPSNGAEASDQPCVEEYLNDPRRVPASELRTAIWLPIAEESEQA
jgi:AraC family transcriptional regulator